MQEDQTEIGQLKIFFSYAPGTAKTQAMLAAARREQELGCDVVVGYLEEEARNGMPSCAQDPLSGKHRSGV